VRNILDGEEGAICSIVGEDLKRMKYETKTQRRIEKAKEECNIVITELMLPNPKIRLLYILINPFV
jgi:hypothetical protein